MARKIRIPDLELSVTAVMTAAVVLTVLAFVLRFAVPIPFVALITGRWGLAFAAMAAGLSGWLLSSRLANPLAAVFALLIFAAAITVTLPSMFGRREIVSVGGAFVWGLFYGSWHHLPTGVLLRRLVLFSVVPFVLMAAHTSTRLVSEKQRTAKEQFVALLTADIKAGAQDVVGGQGAGTASMFLLEAYPETYEYRHLLALRYYFMIPVPRDWWPEKPVPTSSVIAGESFRQNVNVDRLTIGPGIVGQAAAEGGFYALLVYAFLGAVLIRLLDELVTLHPANPLVVMGVASALGQCVGLARGELSTFAFHLTTALIGAYLFLRIGAPLLGTAREQSDEEAPWPVEGADGSVVEGYR